MSTGDGMDGDADSRRAGPSAEAAPTGRAGGTGRRPRPGPGVAPKPVVAPEPADDAVAEPVTAPVAGEPVAVIAPVDLVKRETRAPRPGWLNWLPSGVLAAVIVALLVLGVLASHGVWWAKKHADPAALRGQVLSAAKSCLATMNTYKYTDLPTAEAKGLACTTGKFTAQYKTAFEKLVKPQASKLKFTQAAQINNGGIESISKDGSQWVILVFGQLSTTNVQDGTTTPKLSIFSARVTMQRADGKWLVSAYEYAPSS